MLSNEQKKFIAEQSKGRNGRVWLTIFESLVAGLYSIKGVAKEDWEGRQKAASCIEDNLISIMKTGDQEIGQATNNNEYI